MNMNLAIRFLVFCLLLSCFPPSIASDSGNSPTVATAQPYSANDFDWRDMVPALATAAELPGDQAVKELLENSSILRIYILTQLRAECRSDKSRCAFADHTALEKEITSRIDDIVSKSLVSQHKTAIVDYTLGSQPFPFSEIAAYKSEKQRDAYLVLSLSGRSYTSLRVKAKYGIPFDDDIFQWYGVYKYRLDNADYRSEAVFEIDPPTDAIVKIAISFKPKKNHHPATPPAQPY